MTNGYAELEFDLPGALLESILKHLKEVDAADLTLANTSVIPDEQGVYALYLKRDDQLVYIGKTDGEAGLGRRLTRHARKIDGRQNIGPTDVAFKAIRLYVFTAMDLETALIRSFGGVKNVAWNNSGFGSNDPGKERDTTRYKPDHFDTLYPIRLDEAFVELTPGRQSVAEVMQALKDGLPYLLRFQRPNSSSRSSYHPDFEASLIEVPPTGMTTREAVTACLAALPAGWHATALPSHIIVYKDDTRRYPSGEVIARSE